MEGERKAEQKGEEKIIPRQLSAMFFSRDVTP
jgi:hypothetical protein